MVLERLSEAHKLQHQLDLCVQLPSFTSDSWLLPPPKAAPLLEPRRSVWVVRSTFSTHLSTDTKHTHRLPAPLHHLSALISMIHNDTSRSGYVTYNCYVEAVCESLVVIELMSASHATTAHDAHGN